MPVENGGVNANTGASLDLITATVPAIRPIQDKIIPNGRSKETDLNSTRPKFGKHTQKKQAKAAAGVRLETKVSGKLCHSHKQPNLELQCLSSQSRIAQ